VSQHPHQVPGSPVPHKYPPYHFTGMRYCPPANNVHHEPGTGYGQLFNRNFQNDRVKGQSHDVGRRHPEGRSICEIEEMHINTSTYDQSLRPECLRREMNSLPLYLGNSENIFWHVCSKTPDVERGWRESPPLDRLLACRRRDTDKIKGMTLRSLGGEEVSAENRNGMRSREYFPRQLINALHHPPCI
jgi:hypothetical protein